MDNSVLYVTFTSLPFGWVLASFAVAAVMCFFASPFARRLAILIGAIDVPLDSRRVHKKPIPRMGGLALYMAFTTATLCFFPYLSKSYFGILLGGAVLVVSGIIDDKYNLRPLYKFSFQVVAAAIAVSFGIRIEVLNNILVFSKKEYISLRWLSVPITMGWIILLINAVNLTDGLDGLAAGVACISSITLLIIAVLLNDVNSAVITAALAGACIGFLPYNFNPARIFMGETGASFIGFVLATVSVTGLFKMYTVISVAVPFLILGLPIFEIIFSVLRRILKGQSPVHADKKHIHHRLLAMGLSQKRSVALIYIITAVLCAAAVLFVLGFGRWALLLLTLMAIATIVFAMYKMDASPLVLYRNLKIRLHNSHSPEAIGEEAEEAEGSEDKPAEKPKKEKKPKEKKAKKAKMKKSRSPKKQKEEKTEAKPEEEQKEGKPEEPKKAAETEK